MRLMARMFNSILNLTSYLARRPAFNPITRSVMRLLGWITLLVRRGRSRQSIDEIGNEWQRMFPSKKMVPIKQIENETVFAEIHAQCPLRATGDLQACHRLMEYDRKMLEKIGGQLIILRSQAEKDIQICQVAIRKAGADISDLNQTTRDRNKRREINHEGHEGHEVEEN